MKIYRKRHGTVYMVCETPFVGYHYDPATDHISRPFFTQDLTDLREWLPVPKSDTIPDGLAARLTIPFRPRTEEG